MGDVPTKETMMSKGFRLGRRAAATGTGYSNYFDDRLFGSSTTQGGY
jgi:hypothetical protein